MNLATPADLVIRGGFVIDPVNGVDGAMLDIRIEAGRVTAVGKDLPPSRLPELKAAGQVVTPGLVDVHTHIYEGVCKVGLDPVEAHFRRGVVAAADAGTAGASNFKGFRKFIAEPAPFRVLSLLNVSVLGLIDQRYGELLRPEALHAEEIVAIYRGNEDVIKGLKIRLSHDIVPPAQMLDTLKRAVAVAQELQIPVMAHIGHTEQRLAEIVELLHPGDIVTHCYTGKGNGVLTGGKVDPTVLEARRRGVQFDVGHGTTQMSYDIARTAIAEGFLPDVIGSDLSMNNWMGPAFDLASVMSKLIALGVQRVEAVRATTATPAEILGIRDEGYGAIEVGRPAFLTVFDVPEVPVTLPDSAGDALEVLRWEPTCSVIQGNVNETTPWRGLP